jgi:hypothetical protein
MSQFQFRFQAAAARRIEEEEAERQLTLRSTVRNDPKLLERVRCRVLTPFYVGGGKLAEEGETIALARHDAESMAALKRVLIL